MSYKKPNRKYITDYSFTRSQLTNIINASKCVQVGNVNANPKMRLSKYSETGFPHININYPVRKYSFKLHFFDQISKKSIYISGLTRHKLKDAYMDVIQAFQLIYGESIASKYQQLYPCPVH